jgi:integrase
MGLVSGPFPQLKRVTLAKFEERPPFQTRAEIERQIALGGWTERQIEELWHCLYLRPAEMQALLAHVEKHARPPWLHPLVATAAYTGMRRSELARAEVGDVDLHGNSLIVRERKRRRSEKTTRRVALHPVLRTILQGWLRSHPGGRFLFSHPGVVARSKKRSKLTGYRGKSRATTGQGRLATLRERGTSAVTGLTPNEVHDHFRRTLRDSAWDVLPGLHCLRHSFVSCLASAGCDQRIIDEFVGHQTDQQRRRYRHIFPERKDDALRAAFG